METHQLKRLNDLFNVGNGIVGCTSVKTVIQQAIDRARERVSSQTASVFLFTKEGQLKRIKIAGIDVNGLPINNDWFAEETHFPGQSFTGKAVEPGLNSRYGNPQWSNALRKDQLDPLCRDHYVQKLGTLHCAVAVPLNGRHRTFGVLEVINKLNNRGEPVGGAFSEGDIYWLSIIGMNLANALSRLRSIDELTFLAEMSKMLVEPFSSEVTDNFDPKPFYEHTAVKLVSAATCYKACFLRTPDLEDELCVVARAGHDISWQDEEGGEIKIRKHIAKGEGFSGKVYQNKKPIIIRNLIDRAHEFDNFGWIRLNNLQSYACFPLLIKAEKKAVGTLSVYTGFKHDFESSDVEFLENVAFLIAAFTESVRVIAELSETSQQLHDEFQKVLNSVRQVGFQGLIDEFLHVYKNELNNLHKAFEEYESSRPSKKDEIIEAQTNLIERRIKQIKAQFDITSPVTIDVNSLVRDVVRYFQLDLKGKEISIEPHCYVQLPSIQAKEPDIREVVRNLIDNAVKAIRKANRKQGQITITTGIITEKRISYIQLTVEDNGIGIRNEEKDAIYERGHSSYDGGTGMGLFTVANVIGSYGGSVEHISTVGKGTKFVVKIPVKRHQAS
jgi:signal transduction histidine kinase